MKNSPENTISEIRDLIDALLDEAISRLPTENGIHLTALATIIKGHILELKDEIDTSGEFNDIDAARKDRPFISNMEAAFHALHTQRHLENGNLVEAIKSLVSTYAHLEAAVKRGFEIGEITKEKTNKAIAMIEGRKNKRDQSRKWVQELLGKDKKAGGDKPSSGWASIEQAARTIGECLAIREYTKGKSTPSSYKDCCAWYSSEKIAADKVPGKYFLVEGWIESDKETRDTFKNNASKDALRRLKDTKGQ